MNRITQEKLLAILNSQPTDKEIELLQLEHKQDADQIQRVYGCYKSGKNPQSCLDELIQTKWQSGPLAGGVTGSYLFPVGLAYSLNGGFGVRSDSHNGTRQFTFTGDIGLATALFLSWAAYVGVSIHADFIPLSRKATLGMFGSYSHVMPFASPENQSDLIGGGLELFLPNSNMSFGGGYQHLFLADGTNTGTAVLQMTVNGIGPNSGIKTKK